MALTDLLIHETGALREEFTALQRAGEQHVLRLLRELHDNARRLRRIGRQTRDSCWSTTAAPETTEAAGAATAATPRAACLRDVEVVADARGQPVRDTSLVRIPRRQLERVRHRRRVLRDAAAGAAATTAASGYSS